VTTAPSAMVSMVMALILAMLVAISGEADAADVSGRPIIRQEFDTSCGLAALATILIWSGRPTSEKQLHQRLEALIKPDTSHQQTINERGLKVRHMIALIDDLQLSDNAARRSISEIRTALRREPVLVMVYISDNSADPGHFTVVERARPDGGFDLADPVFDRVFWTEKEFAKGFARKDGRGISFVPRTKGGQSLFHGFHETRATNEALLPIPSLQSQLLKFGALQLGKGKIAVDFDLKKVAGPRFPIIDADGIRVTGKQTTTVATTGIRYGVGVDTTVSLSLPALRTHESVHIEADGNRHQESSIVTSIAQSFDLGVTSNFASTTDGSFRFSADGSATISRHGRLLGGAAGVTTTWSNDGSGISLLTGRLGITHARPDTYDQTPMTSLSIGAAAVIPVRDSLNLTITVQKELPQKSGFAPTTSVLTGINFSVTKQLTAQPYLTIDWTGGQLSRGAGLTFTYNWPREMF